MPAEGRRIWLTSIPVLVNGEQRYLAPPGLLGSLIADLALDTRKVAVERNEAIVPRSEYAQTFLTAGDRLEIVHFIGGG